MRSILLFIFIVSFLRASSPKEKPFPNNLNFIFQETKSVFYNSGTLSINGFYGEGLIQIYSIIGNKIIDVKVQNLSKFNLQVDLENNNMYIIRILNQNKIKTFKIVVN